MIVKNFFLRSSPWTNLSLIRLRQHRAGVKNSPLNMPHAVHAQPFKLPLLAGRQNKALSHDRRAGSRPGQNPAGLRPQNSKWGTTKPSSIAFCYQ